MRDVRSPQPRGDLRRQQILDAAVELFAGKGYCSTGVAANGSGKSLNVSSFTSAGNALRDVILPGSGGPVSFGRGRDYAIGDGVPDHIRPHKSPAANDEVGDEL